MAVTNSIDIMGSLEDALGAITSSKVDLGLSMNLPFTTTQRNIEDNQKLIDKMTAVQKVLAERERIKAEGIRTGLDLRAPFETRISGR